ncbi:2195_t:CDS:2, partial [Scutellospora calospora]
TFDKVKHKNVQDNIKQELNELLDSWVDENWTLLNENINYEIHYECNEFTVTIERLIMATVKELKSLLKLNSVKIIKKGIINLIELNEDEISETESENSEESYDDSDSEESEELIKKEIEVACKKYKKKIQTLLNNNGFECRSYENENELFYSDRDKYLVADYENFKIFICCKFRDYNNIGFNDVERTSRFMKSYHKEDTGVIVTNQNYSENAYDQAYKMKILVCQTQNLLEKIKKEIE